MRRVMLFTLAILLSGLLCWFESVNDLDVNAQETCEFDLLGWIDGDTFVVGANESYMSVGMDGSVEQLQDYRSPRPPFDALRIKDDYLNFEPLADNHWLLISANSVRLWDGEDVYSITDLVPENVDVESVPEMEFSFVGASLLPKHPEDSLVLEMVGRYERLVLYVITGPNVPGGVMPNVRSPSWAQGWRGDYRGALVVISYDGESPAEEDLVVVDVDRDNFGFDMVSTGMTFVFQSVNYLWSPDGVKLVFSGDDYNTDEPRLYLWQIDEDPVDLTNLVCE